MGRAGEMGKLGGDLGLEGGASGDSVLRRKEKGAEGGSEDGGKEVGAGGARRGWG